jgi:AraC-like DNA-binding protein
MSANCFLDEVHISGLLTRLRYDLMTQSNHFTTKHFMRQFRSQPPMVSVFYVNLIIETVARFGVGAAELLEGSTLTLEDIERTDKRVDYFAFSYLLNRAVKLTHEPGLGFLLGMQMRVSSHGMLGYAAMVSGTLGQALELALRYTEIQTATVLLHSQRVGDQIVLTIEQRLPDYPLGEMVISFLMVGFGKMAEMLAGKSISGYATITYPRPEHFSRFEHLLPGKISFDQPSNTLIFAAEVLDIPIMMSDPVALRLSEDQCKRELQQLMDRRSFSQLVREILLDEANAFGSLDDVAAQLHMTPRTLQRYLTRESLTFKELIASLRKEKAQQLLTQNKLSMQEIAEALGYDEPTNFSRAFKTWTNESPRSYQQRIAGK